MKDQVTIHQERRQCKRAEQASKKKECDATKKQTYQGANSSGQIRIGS